MPTRVVPDGFGWLCRKTFDDKFILDEHMQILLSAIMPYTDDVYTIETCIHDALASMKKTPSMYATLYVIGKALYG